MALMKCPDCENMVSPRVTQCPFCGCPSNFFMSTSQEGVNEVNRPETEKSYEYEENCSPEYLKTTFSFWGMTISYPYEIAEYAKLYGKFSVLAEEACITIAKVYASQDLNEAVNTIPNVGNNFVDKALSIGIQYLFENNIIINKKQFLEHNDRWRNDAGKYVGHYYGYEKFYSPIIDEYKQIESARIRMQKEREIQIQSRPRWQGGGFGIRGAIKGAATAGILNMGSDFLHSFGDESNRIKDARVIARQIEKLYTNKNTLYTLCEGIKTCIRQIFNAVVYEMTKNNYFNKNTYDVINYTKAVALYDNTMEYAQDMDMDIQQVSKNLVKCIIYYPGEPRFYEILFERVLAQDDDFVKFLEFWNLTEIFSADIENYKNALEFDSYFEEVKDILMCKETLSVVYASISPFLYKYYKQKMSLMFPQKFSDYGECIQRIIDELKDPKFSPALTQYRLTEWIPEKCNVYEFIDYLKYIRETVPICFLNRMELYGDEELSADYIALLNDVKKDNDVVLMNFNYYVEEGFFTRTKYNDGLAVTTKYIIFLKDLTKFNICDIEEMIWALDGSIQISDAKKSIVWKNKYLDNRKYIDVIDHFGKLLTIYCVRYGNNSRLWNSKMTTKKP